MAGIWPKTGQMIFRSSWASRFYGSIKAPCRAASPKLGKLKQHLLAIACCTQSIFNNSSCGLSSGRRKCANADQSNRKEPTSLEIMSCMVVLSSGFTLCVEESPWLLNLPTKTKPQFLLVKHARKNTISYQFSWLNKTFLLDDNGYKLQAPPDRCWHVLTHRHPIAEAQDLFAGGLQRPQVTREPRHDAAAIYPCWFIDHGKLGISPANITYKHVLTIKDEYMILYNWYMMVGWWL
jgi:hypothetical protein